MGSASQRGEIRSLSIVGRSLNLNLNQDDSIPIKPSLGRVITEQSLSFFPLRRPTAVCSRSPPARGKEGQDLLIDSLLKSRATTGYRVPTPILPIIESRIGLLPVSKLVYLVVHKCRNIWIPPGAYKASPQTLLALGLASLQYFFLLRNRQIR
jgi:hypothetical protein